MKMRRMRMKREKDQTKKRKNTGKADKHINIEVQVCKYKKIYKIKQTDLQVQIHINTQKIWKEKTKE